MPRIHTISPTLIIGLGGTGAKVVRELKKDLGNIPIVKYLVVDADIAEKEGFDDFEFVNVGIDEKIKKIVNELPGLEDSQKSEVEKWFPSNPLKAEIFKSEVALTRGAGQVRALGRLCLYYNAAEVFSRFTNLLLEITDMRRAQEAVRAGYDVNPDDRRVIIVSSLGGGCGSGMFLDVAYLIKYVIDYRALPDFKVNGIFVLPSAFRDSAVRMKNVQANTYAACMELNHYMSNPNFKCRYGYDIEINNKNIGTKKPFDYVYLVSGNPERGFQLDIDHITKIIAETILNVISFKITGDIQAAYQNQIDPCLLSTFNNAIKAYSSFGYTYTTIRFDEIEDYLTFRLASDILSFLLRDPDSDDVSKEVNYFVTGTLQPQKLNNEITKDSLQKPKFADDDSKTPVGRIEDWKNGIKSQILPQLKQKIRNRKEGFLDKKVKALLNEKTETYVLSLDYNPKFARNFISTLKIKVEVFKNKFEREEKEVNKKLNNAVESEQNFLEEYDRVIRRKLVRGGTIRHKKSELIQEIKSQLEYKLELERIGTILELYMDVLKMLSDKEKEIDNIILKISNMVDILRHKYENAFALIYEFGLPYEKVIYPEEEWLDRKYEECSENLPSIVNAFLQGTHRLTTWLDLENETIIDKITEFARERVVKGKLNKSIIDYMEDGELRREIKDIVERSYVLWRLRGGIQVEPTHIVTILVVEKDKIGKIDEIKPPQVSEVIGVEDPSSIGLLQFKYCVPITGLQELDICERLYDAISEDFELHSDYSKKFKKL